MKQFYLLVSFILVFNSHNATAQNDSIYFWKGGVLDLKKSIKTADLDSITFKRVVPLGPTGLTGETISTTEIRLMWTDRSNNETKFKIDRKLVGGTFAVVGTTAKDIATFNDTGLTPATTYIYRVYSYNPAGISITYSNEFSLTTTALLPTLTTTTATSITTTSASSGGSITSDGGASISSKGVCWSSTSSSPTIALSTKTSNGSGTGSFSSSITGLTAATTYYIRAYATNSAGTAYGSVVSFTTTALLPTVTTTTATSITTTSASSGGVIASDGGASITSKGVCWSSTSSSPTIALSTKTSNGSGTGSFTSSLTGLSSGTTYYVRAYATNSAGTAYGSVVSFTTISGITLPSVTIGTQIWTSKNLDVATYSDGTPIPEVTDLSEWAALTTGAWCYYNNDPKPGRNPSNGAVYGKLYNWYAVAGIWNEASKTDANQRKQLAPSGYHVPSDTEWTTITNYLGGEAVAGGEMKVTGYSDWWTPNTDATNSSGFEGLPGGYRDGNFLYDGGFLYIGDVGMWWSSSSSEYDPTWKKYLYLSYNSGNAGISWQPQSKGFSVRLIKN